MDVKLVHLELDVKLQVTPFVKWAGGKSQLLGQFEPFFPIQFNRYVEPFVGGGAVFFHLFNKGLINNNGVILNDLNRELMTCYEVIRDRVEELIEELCRHEPYRTKKSY